MESKLVSAYEQIASGHRQLAEYYSSLASSACPSELPSAVASGIESKASETPKAKKPKDPNAPKRPMSSFLLFANERRAAMKEAHPEMSHTEITRELGNLWKTVDHSVYEERATVLMNEFKVESETYKKTNPNPIIPEKRQRKKKVKSSETSADESVSPATESVNIDTPKADATLAVSPKPVKVQASPAKTTVAEPVAEKLPETSQESDGQKEKKKKKKSKHTSEVEQPASPEEASAEAQPATQEEPKPKKHKKNKEHTLSQVSVTA